jgi:N6-adenosine-specific RNA methylase IME4
MAAPPRITVGDAKLANHAVEIRRLGKRIVGDVIEIGKRLTECKDICGHGNWLPWLNREFGWTDQTARNFIQVYELARAKSQNFLNLDIPVSGLYLLAAPSTPEKARVEVIDRAEAGEMVTHQAVKETVNKHKQPAPMSPSMSYDDALGAYRAIVAKDIQVKQLKRAAREAALGEAQAAGNLALPNKRYGVVLADPEWRFEPWSRETGMDRAADNHYPTSATDEIASRDVPSIAADDCVLFLWATVPMLPEALAVMKAWGFEYRSNFTWGKNKISTGYWNRNKHEHLLVGVKGKIPAPAMGTQWESLIDGDVRGHSVKPDWQYELIEAYYPTLPKIELNARRSRPGWDSWGDEAPRGAAESAHTLAMSA